MADSLTPAAAAVTKARANMHISARDLRRT